VDQFVRLVTEPGAVATGMLSSAVITITTICPDSLIAYGIRSLPLPVLELTRLSN